VNATALLGRLKFDPLGAFRRGGQRFRNLHIVKRWRYREREPRKPLPAALVAAFGGLGLALAALSGWLALSGEDTTLTWEAGIPQVTVAVKGSAPPAPAPVQAAKPPAPPAASAPAPAVSPMAPAPITPAPAPDAVVALTPAPAPGLVEDTKVGPLPRAAEDGRKPWQVYARPFPVSDKRPRIAIVVADMGLSGVTTNTALQKLPPSVTLAFLPYAERLDTWVEQARTKGHEVMLSVPMEPQGFPRDDPGPNALLTTLAPDRNLERLHWSMSRVTGYTGITTTTGSKFTGNADALKPLMDDLRARGLLFLDARLTPKSQGAAAAEKGGVPRAAVDRVIDRDLARNSIDEQLRELEAIAKQQGSAVGIGFPYPSTIERINLWLTGLQDRGIVLAPLSAVVTQPKGPGG